MHCHAHALSAHDGPAETSILFLASSASTHTPDYVSVLSILTRMEEGRRRKRRRKRRRVRRRGRRRGRGGEGGG